MEFRTSIKANEGKGFLNHSDGVVMIGSCFSDNVGARMRQAMMQVDINPFGTLYNPMSIAASVHRIIEARPVESADMVHANGLWNSYLFHSRYSRVDKMAAMKLMNERIERAHRHLRQARLAIFTLGTAVTYRLKTDDRVVSNCHKLPQHNFRRGIEEVGAMGVALLGMVEALHLFNPDLRIVFTVSPIRHIADGLETNSLSKAALRLAVETVRSQYPDIVDYFPAYEIMLDDLRDYRFYAADMVHPTDVAVDYIWQIFQATYLADRAAPAVARCERVWKRLMHRPNTESREMAERFNSDTLAVVKNLAKEYPYITSIREVRNLLDSDGKNSI